MKVFSTLLAMLCAFSGAAFGSDSNPFNQSVPDGQQEINPQTGTLEFSMKHGYKVPVRALINIGSIVSALPVIFFGTVNPNIASSVGPYKVAIVEEAIANGVALLINQEKHTKTRYVLGGVHTLMALNDFALFLVFAAAESPAYMAYFGSQCLVSTGNALYSFFWARKKQA